jgi:hypothetical protein
MDSAASYCPLLIPCSPPWTTSALYAAVKRMIVMVFFYRLVQIQNYDL